MASAVLYFFELSTGNELEYPVVCTLDKVGYNQQQTTNQNGRVQFTDVVVGDYILNIVDNDQKYVCPDNLNIKIFDYQPVAASYKFPNPQRIYLARRAPPKITLSWIIKRSDTHAPLEGVIVSIRKENGNASVALCVSQVGGKAQVKIPPGTDRVVVKFEYAGKIRAAYILVKIAENSIDKLIEFPIGVDPAPPIPPDENEEINNGNFNVQITACDSSINGILYADMSSVEVALGSNIPLIYNLTTSKWETDTEIGIYHLTMSVWEEEEELYSEWDYYEIEDTVTGGNSDGPVVADSITCATFDPQGDQATNFEGVWDTWTVSDNYIESQNPINSFCDHPIRETLYTSVGGNPNSIYPDGVSTVITLNYNPSTSKWESEEGSAVDGHDLIMSMWGEDETFFAEWEIDGFGDSGGPVECNSFECALYDEEDVQTSEFAAYWAELDATNAFFIHDLMGQVP